MKRIYENYVGSNDEVLVVETLQETNDIVVLAVFIDRLRKGASTFDRACAGRQGTKILQFLPKFFQRSEVLSYIRITLLKGKNFFLKIRNPKNVALTDFVHNIHP